MREVRPWRSALSDERCLPGSVRGPVEWRDGQRRWLMGRKKERAGVCDCVGGIEVVSRCHFRTGAGPVKAALISPRSRQASSMIWAEMERIARERRGGSLW